MNNSSATADSFRPPSIYIEMQGYKTLRLILGSFAKPIWDGESRHEG